MKTKTKIITWSIWSLSVIGAVLVYLSVGLILGGLS